MKLTLTRPVRQVLATILLLGGAVVPTLLVATIAWRINQPGHVRDVEVRLGRELGCRVTLEAVRYPQPGLVVYHGIIVHTDDPRSGGLNEAVRADSVVVEMTGNEASLIAEGLTFRAESPSQARSILANLIHRSSRFTGLNRVGLSALRCKIEPGLGLESTEVEDLAVSLQLDREAPGQLQASMQARKGNDRTRCELSLTHEQAATTLTVKTMSGPPLTAKALTPFFDVESWLGTKANLSGTLTMTQVGTADWTLLFQGELANIDLASLVSGRFPDHELNGLGRLLITSARWGDRPGQDHGWVQAHGKLAADQGSIGRSLLDALRDQMRFRLVPAVGRLEAETNRLDFRGLGLAFALKADGEIELTGGFGPKSTPDAVLIAANEVSPLAFAPLGVSSVRGLIKALCPAKPESLMPVTAESRMLQRYLPLPVVKQALIEPKLMAQ